MQRITRETNFSEAAFVKSEGTRRGGYHVRIFDSIEELPFAGHPTLGTAFVIREHLHEDRPDEIRLDLGVGRIPVRVERDEEGDELLWMRQIPPSFEESSIDRSSPRTVRRGRSSLRITLGLSRGGSRWISVRIAA